MNTVYPLWFKKVVEGNGPFWAGSLWRVALVDVTYVYSDAHEFLSSATSAIQQRSDPLTSVAVLADGVINADPADLAAYIGSDAPGAIIYHDTVGADSLKEVALFFDTLNGLPVAGAADVPITLNWNDDSDKIARL